MRRVFVGKFHSTYWLIAAAIILVAAIMLVVIATGPTRTYTFVDDFNGSAGAAPDQAKWTYDLGAGGWGNNELQTYTDSRDNSFLDGQGNLVIRAIKQPDNSYTSARLNTAGRFSQRYGHWEMRAKINSQSGLWPAWWMLGDNFGKVGWPRCGEVDMVEDYGFSAVESSVHTGTNDTDVKTFSGDTENDDDQYHTFRMDWTPRGVSFSRDGVRYASHIWSPRGPSDPSQPMFMLLNLAVGGNVGNPPPDANFPVDLVVDYVRVWK